MSKNLRGDFFDSYCRKPLKAFIMYTTNGHTSQDVWKMMLPIRWKLANFRHSTPIRWPICSKPRTKIVETSYAEKLQPIDNALADHVLLHSTIGYWRNPVVRPSFCLWRCALWFQGWCTCTSVFLAGMFLFVRSGTCYRDESFSHKLAAKKWVKKRERECFQTQTTTSVLVYSALGVLTVDNLS